MSSERDRYAIPASVSRQAADILRGLYSAHAAIPPRERPQSLEDWDEWRDQSEAMRIERGRAALATLAPDIADEEWGGVPVIRVKRGEGRSDARRVLYIHDGGYVFGSARSFLPAAARLATVCDIETLVVDYTTAPHGSWRQATDEVLAVWQAVLDSGGQASRTAITGQSAGGGLAAGSILKMRDRDLPLPAALYLQSPWSDITQSGDTNATLAAAEPFLKPDHLVWCADAYADREDQRHPYVSPIYGDYAIPFVPTLIQVGTREMFLSDAVRLYQAIRNGGTDAILDVYEGMPHGFPAMFVSTPEAEIAERRAAGFLSQHVRGAG